MRVVGLDPAGSSKRTTGFCSLDENLNTTTSALHTNQEIVSETVFANPGVVSIDAPLFPGATALPTILIQRGPFWDSLIDSVSIAWGICDLRKSPRGNTRQTQLNRQAENSKHSFLDPAGPRKFPAPAKHKVGGPRLTYPRP